MALPTFTRRRLRDPRKPSGVVTIERRNRVPTPTKDLRAFVGKHVRIERDGVIHTGVLMGEVFRHVRGRKVASRRWVLETDFKANDGWTVTLLRRTTKRTNTTTRPNCGAS
jgi:hypothetical protein